MPSISTDTRVILWIVATIAGALFAVIGNELAKNFVYFFSRRGRPPAKRPVLVWVIFFLSLAISIVSGAFAAFAPVPLYSANNIRLVPIGDQNIIAKLGNQSISADDVIPLNEQVTVMFKILNNGISPVTIMGLVIGSRGPGVNCDNPNVEKWSAPVISFPTPKDITIQPGEEYVYEGSRAFYLPGKYFLEPIIQGPSGNWGGIQPFSCISITVDGTESPPTKTPSPTATSLLASTETPTSPPASTNTPITASQPVCISWEFETDGDTEGWIPGWAGRVRDTTALNGSLVAHFWHNDPFWQRPGLTLDSSSYKELRIRYRINATNVNPTMQFMWRTDASGDIQYWIEFPVKIDNSWNEKVIDDLQDESFDWQGTIIYLRLDPVKDAINGIDGTAEIDYVRLCPPS